MRACHRARLRQALAKKEAVRADPATTSDGRRAAASDVARSLHRLGNLAWRRGDAAAALSWYAAAVKLKRGVVLELKKGDHADGGDALANRAARRSLADTLQCAALVRFAQGRSLGSSLSRAESEFDEARRTIRRER